MRGQKWCAKHRCLSPTCAKYAAWCGACAQKTDGACKMTSTRGATFKRQTRLSIWLLTIRQCCGKRATAMRRPRAARSTRPPCCVGSAKTKASAWRGVQTQRCSRRCFMSFYIRPRANFTIIFHHYSPNKTFEPELFHAFQPFSFHRSQPSSTSSIFHWLFFPFSFQRHFQTLNIVYVFQF